MWGRRQFLVPESYDLLEADVEWREAENIRHLRTLSEGVCATRSRHAPCSPQQSACGGQKGEWSECDSKT